MSALPDNSRPPASPFASLPSLDGVRAVAILLVLAHQLNRIEVAGPASKIIEKGADLGWIGVQLFFCLSGFLITGILLDGRDSPQPLRDFYVRRVLRVFPLYYGALILFVVLLPAAGLAPREWSQGSLWHWLFLANWTIPYGGSPLPHFWSLAIEEQFYLLWPFIVLALAPRKLLAACLAIAAGALVFRVGAVAGGMEPEAIYMGSFARFDALALGSAAAVVVREPGAVARIVSRQGRAWAGLVVLFLAGAVATRLYPRTTPLGQTIGYSVLALVFSGAIGLLAATDVAGKAGAATGWLRTRAMQAIGTCSFGMYVFHKPLHDLVGKQALAALGYPESVPLGVGLAYIGAGTVVVFLAGLISYTAYERRFLRLARRLAPRAGARPPGLVAQRALPRRNE